MVRLRLLHFNDLHNYLTAPHAVRGHTHAFSQTVKIVCGAGAAAGANEAVQFTSSGDDQTGNVLDELIGFTPAELIAHAAYHAFSTAGIDAMVLGIHEFDRGTRMLRFALARYPAVPAFSANVYGAPDPPRGELYHPAAAALAKGLRIGILGLTTAEHTRINTLENLGLSVASPLSVLERLLPVLAAASDVVVILSHLRYGSGQDPLGHAGAERAIRERDAAAAEAAARLTDRPVLILAGHSHAALNVDGIEGRNLIAGRVLIAQAGARGSPLKEVTAEIALGETPRLVGLSARLVALKRADRRVPTSAPPHGCVPAARGDRPSLPGPRHGADARAS